VLEGPPKASPEAKAPQSKILSVLRREDGQNGRINGIRYRYSAQYQYQYQYTVYMVQYTAAYWTRTHRLYYPTVHDHEHTPGAWRCLRTPHRANIQATPRCWREATLVACRLGARWRSTQHQALGAGERWEQSAPTPTWMAWRVVCVCVYFACLVFVCDY